MKRLSPGLLLFISLLPAVTQSVVIENASNAVPGSITQGFFRAHLEPSETRQNAMRLYRGLHWGSDFRAELTIFIPVDWESVPGHQVMVMVMHPAVSGSNYWRVYLQDLPDGGLNWHFLSKDGSFDAPARRGESHTFFIRHDISGGFVEISIGEPLTGSSNAQEGQFVPRVPVTMYDDIRTGSGKDEPYFEVGMDTSAFPLSVTRDLYFKVRYMRF